MQRRGGYHPSAFYNSFACTAHPLTEATVCGSGPFLDRLPIFLGAHARIIFKDLGKILYVHDPAMERHGLDLQTGSRQQMGGMADPLVPNVLGDGFSRFLLKKGAKIAGAYVMRRRQ